MNAEQLQLNIRVKIMDEDHPYSWMETGTVEVDNVEDPKNPNIEYHLIKTDFGEYFLVDVTNCFEIFEPQGEGNGSIILMEV